MENNRILSPFVSIVSTDKIKDKLCSSRYDNKDI